MHDAVGEVLAQRQALDSGAGSGIAFSLLLHGLIISVAMYAALRHPQPQSVPMIVISFARAAVPAITTPAPAPVPALTAPQPQPKPVAQPPAKTVPLSPFGKSTKKGAETPPVPQPPTRNPQPTVQQPAVQIPVGGTGAVVEGDFPYTIYIDRMKTLVGEHWFRPQAATGVATTVYFVIERDGALRDARTEAESGNGTFDRAALRAVLESSPLPPLPFGYSGSYLGVHLTFR